MKKLLTSAVFLLILSVCLSVNIALLKPAAAESSIFKISGYILDSNNHGISGANLIFNVPTIVPSVYSNQAGYYEIYAPAGTYHINVWPPFDANYIDYDEPGFFVSSDMTKNITLYSGCKVSGYISDSAGTPVTGAVVFLDNYGSGWFSNSKGYYFLSVPEGTYTIDAHPRIGIYASPTTNFPTYYEYNFPVYSDTIKNIIVNTEAPEPTPPTTPDLISTHLSISTDALSFPVGSTITVNGILTDRDGIPIGEGIVILSYAVGNSASWIQIGSALTNSMGEYSVQWKNEASGTFTLKAQWNGGNGYGGSYHTTTLSILPQQNSQIFFVESNSTVTELDFNSINLVLGFSVTGQSGTTGYTKVTMAKTLAPDSSGPIVFLDGREADFTVTSTEEYWIVAFTYSHSTHQVEINLSSDAKETPIPTGTAPNITSWIILATAIVLAIVALSFIIKTRIPPKVHQKRSY